MTTPPSKNTYDAYNEAMSAYLFKMPFYFYWVAQTEYKEVVKDDLINVTGMAPSFTENSYKLKVDKERFPKMELPGRMFALARNVLNMVYLHGASDYAHHPLWPLAGEVATNTKLLANGMKMPPDPDQPEQPAFITPEYAADAFEQMWKMWEGSTGQQRPAAVSSPVVPPVGTKAADFYFKWALDNAPPGMGGNNGSGVPMSGLPQDMQDKINEVLDKAGKDYAPMTPEQKEMAQVMAGEMAQEASTHAGAPPGFLAGDIENLIKALKPKIRWQDKLTNFTGQLGRMEIKPSHARENKYGQVPRISLKPNKKILVAIDTSGSVSDQLLSQFLAELESIAQNTDVDLMYVDYGVQDVQPFKKAADSSYKVKGRGGTDMREIFRWIKQNKYVVDGVIVQTDGETPYPTREERMGLRTLWLISSDQITAPEAAGETVHFHDNTVPKH